ncbi:MAG: ATP-binding protein, partial [Candidatus Zixiibacteriota bacterium]
TCVVVADCHRQIMIFNRQAAEVFGCNSSDMIGRPIDEIFAPGSREICTSTETTSSSNREVLCRRFDGAIFPAYLIMSPVITRAGQTGACLLLIRDISESRSFQEMMIRLDRYYTRGEMAAAVAHEMNNYLAVLSGNTELLPMYLKKGDVDRSLEKLDVMKRTLDKIARFANGLMDTDPDELILEQADVNQIVENTLAFLKPQNKFDRVTICTHLSPQACLATIDMGQMQQLLVNLVYNAADALEEVPENRTIRIATSLVEDASKRLVQIEVRDNGPGVPEDRQDLLFAKRFTTKRRGHGLGLITCRKIVEQHHGRITYNYDGGAVFTVTIPVSPPHGEEQALAVAQPASTTAPL